MIFQAEIYTKQSRTAEQRYETEQPQIMAREIIYSVIHSHS